jgi:hypothetical protein
MLSMQYRFKGVLGITSRQVLECTSLLSGVFWGLFPSVGGGGVKDWSTEVTTHLHLVSRLRMTGPLVSFLFLTFMAGCLGVLIMLPLLFYDYNIDKFLF